MKEEYASLKQELRNLTATGESGFEGIVATLLTALTGDHFYVARSGDQPADAISRCGDVAMQAKLYSDNKPLEASLEHDFNKSCRLVANLDCFVLVTTRSVAQLRELATTLQDKECVDIVMVGGDGPRSELAALCTTFWETIRHHVKLKRLDSPGFKAWAKKRSTESSTRELVDRLRGELTSSTPLASVIHRRLHGSLNHRFCVNPDPTPTLGNAIRLPGSIKRDEPLRKLDDWWSDGTRAAAVVSGEEGMGKTWVAAQFAHKLSSESRALVIWLDSINWSDTDGVESAVHTGLEIADTQGSRLLQRLTKKALTRWSTNLLIVFDGINERGARNAARQLMQLLTTTPRTCRALFTTRPIRWASDESRIWDAATEIRIDRFSESEFQQALRQCEPPVLREEVLSGIADLAKCPRYFHQCIKLRARFRSFRDVTKEMVLWEDLLQKVVQQDPQMVEHIRWATPTDLKRALTKIADAARKASAEERHDADGYAILNGAFEDRYQQIRFDLAEQRIVIEPTGDNPRISPDHVTLGYALFIGSMAARLGNCPLAEMVDRLAKELEPMGNQDQLSESLFVALQLSALAPDSPLNIDSTARAALLFLWTSSQNSIVNADRLEFWAGEDLEAYLKFVEEIYLEPVSEYWSRKIIQPLLVHLEKTAPGHELMECRLRRWLKLVWKSHDFSDGKDFVYNGHTLPTARTRWQLALGCAAVALISKRPDHSFIDDLAIAWATARLSTYRHYHSRTPSGPRDKYQEMECKNLHHNLGALMRWCYTESVKPVLLSHLETLGHDGVIRRGLEGMLETFDRFGWRHAVPEKALQKGRPLFSCSLEESRNRFVNCPELAIRDDLPVLSENDQAIIADKVERAFADSKLRDGCYTTGADHELSHYLAWYARYRESEFIRLSTDFRLRALSYPDFSYALSFCQLLPMEESAEASTQILAGLIDCASRVPDRPDGSRSWMFTELHITALTCLMEGDLKSWLEYAGEIVELRKAFHYYPIMLLVPHLVSQSMAEAAREQARRSFEMAAVEPEKSEGSSSRFDYWATIGGLAGDPDAAYHSWITQKFGFGGNAGIRPFYGALLWFRTATNQQLEAAVSDGSLFVLLDKYGWRAIHEAGRQVRNWRLLTADYRQLTQWMPIDYLGHALFQSGRDCDFETWGHDLFRAGFDAIRIPHVERIYWGVTIHHVDADGRIGESGCTDSPTQEDLGVRPSHPRDLRKLLASWSETDEQDNEATRRIRLWQEDQQRLDAAGVESLDRFGARRELEAWRDRFPIDFRTRAERLLRKASSDVTNAFHIGGFLAAVLDTLIPIEPRMALDLDSSVAKDKLKVNVINQYGEPTFYAAFWNAAGSGNQECQKICSEFVVAATDDDELMSHSVMAQAEGAGKFLREHCMILLKEELAKVRCVAVSLMAWIADQNNVNTLEKLAADDPSGWVRKHAEWAAGVARQETAAVTHYRKTLAIEDRNCVLARLSVLKPALTRTSRWWHGKLEREYGFEKIHKDVVAALSHFWYDFRNWRRTPPPAVNGREMKGYLRGECIKDLVEPSPQLMA